MKRSRLTSACLMLAGMLGTRAVLAGQLPPAMAGKVHVRILHDVHVAGRILHGGTASGDDGREHLLVGVKLDRPLEDGVAAIEATVTHNEPSQRIRMSIAIYSGHAPKAGRVDLTCPSVRVVTLGAHRMAMGEECTFHDYKGPIASPQ